jgi:GTP 3',8-cyclase
MTVALPAPAFRADWRRAKCRAFDLPTNSSSRRLLRFALWGRAVEVYAGANLSIYSGQKCNAACPFCVEELRPAARGRELDGQRTLEVDDHRYLARLEESLESLRPLAPTIAITGGEPSKDPRLPGILQLVRRYAAPKRTLTTNGSGLLDRRAGRRVIDWIAEARLDHLNLSIAVPDLGRNARLMKLPQHLDSLELREVVRLARAAGIRVRLSCVLLRLGVKTLEGMVEYLRFAEALGIDNVIFRQLMMTDPAAHLPGPVVRFSDAQRVALEPLLEEITADPRFAFERQVMGYYYYVEVWRCRGIDVVFEEADLAQLETRKRLDAGTVHELVFHPDGNLASTWQPWDGVLGPPAPPLLRAEDPPRHG